jgi:hypothetical protein
MPGERRTFSTSTSASSVTVETAPRRAPRPLGAPRRHRRRQLAHDQPGARRPRRLVVGGVDADVADLGRGHDHDLAGVGRVGDHLLVAGQRGVEHDLAEALAGRAEADAAEDRAVLEREEGLHRRPARALTRPRG